MILNPLEPKDPNAVLDYQIDWSDWLRAGDSIGDSEWIVPDGIEKDSDSFNSTTTTIWISGGTAGTNYAFTNRITTIQGRTQDRTVTIPVKEL